MSTKIDWCVRANDVCSSCMKRFTFGKEIYCEKCGKEICMNCKDEIHNCNSLERKSI